MNEQTMQVVTRIKYTLHVVPVELKEQIQLGTTNVVCGAASGRDYIYVTMERSQ